MNSYDEFPLMEQHFFLPGPAGKLEVLTSSPTEHVFPTVAIICHPHPLQEGTMNNKVVTTLHRTFRDLGVKTVRFNFRGVGLSAGQYAYTEGEVADLIAVYHWVKKVCPEQTVWIAGFSFGAYISAYMANDYPVDRLITIAPPVNHFNFSLLNTVRCPWIIVQGSEDEIVPASLVRVWQSNITGYTQYVEIPQASHFFHGKLVELKTELIHLLKTQ